MSRRLTTEQFIQRAILVHGGRYDYTASLYVGSTDPIDIICPLHGAFAQKPDNHIRGSGCPSCGKVKSKINSCYTVSYYLNKSKAIHGDKYDYSFVDFVNSSAKVIIICRIHGEFLQSLHSHLQGHGCSLCKNSYLSTIKTWTTSMFTETANIVHDKKYNYSQSVYVGSKSKICIVCPDHGLFRQTPNRHLMGGGCPSCTSSKGEAIIRNVLSRHNIEFIPQYRFDDCKYKNTLPFDFYIPKYSMCIEFHGIQHYEPLEFFNKSQGFEVRLICDKIKEAYCLKNSVPLLIIPYWEMDNIEAIVISYQSKQN